MQVVVVKLRPSDGNIDLGDLRAKADRSTRPSWRADGDLSVDARRVRGIDRRDLRADPSAGGQVYMDGANMNAQVGLTSPARSAPTSAT
jgi:glycine dehydrogenase